MSKSRSRSDFINSQGFQPVKQNPLIKLAKTLSVYDSADLLATLAGLQLMPENADRAVRFEALTRAVASISSKGFGSKKKVNLKQLEKICNHPSDLEPFICMEDPFNNPFTEAFTFHGGSYIVFPGIAEEETFILRHLAKAIFLSSDPFPNQQFATAACGLISAVLAISNEIARRVGLERGVEPVIAPKGDVIVPSVKRLEELKQAVFFSESELSNLLIRHNAYLFEIEPLIVALGNVSIEDCKFDSSELLVCPIVKANNGFIVAIPGMLLSAARNELIRLAFEYEVTGALAERYCDSVEDTVTESLGCTDWNITSVSPPNPPDIPCFRNAFFCFDVDKVAYVAIVTDSLNEYDCQDPFGCWNLDEIGVKLETRIKEIYEYTFTALPGVNEVLFLLILQDFGRYQMRTFGKLPESEPLLIIALSAGDLETITLLEVGNSLMLWKYAKASWRLEKQAQVISHSELDKFSIYRDKGYTYYVSDKINPNHPNSFMFSLEGTAQLRQEVLHKRDFHAVPSYKKNSLIEVTSRFNTREIPIYFPKPILRREPQPPTFLVEGLPIPVWILSSGLENDSQEKLYNLYAQFAETISYWLWQFIPSLSPIIQFLVSEHRQIVIQLFIPPDEAWNKIIDPQESSDELPVNIQADSAKGTVNLIILSSISSFLQGFDNRGERYMMQNILCGFRELLPDSHRGKLSDEVITRIIDNHAPLGIKKKLLFLDTAINPELDDKGLLKYRKVQEADEDELLDELGNYLSSVEKLKEGSIDDSQRTAVLQKTVAFFYQELQKLVASLNPEKLLEHLVVRHEAIVQEVAEHRLTIPTQLACFSSELDMVKELGQEIPERNQAALASRVVIEYVVAQPPAGIRPLSLSVYDRLQALASHIVNFGFESDLINFELADSKLEMLPSGRLGTDREEYDKAREAYMSIFTGGEIARSTSEFKRYWRKPEAVSNKPEFLIQLDKAASIEFCFSITELQELFGEAINIGRTIHPSVASLPLKNLVTRLANQLGWTPEKVSHALELLSLSPRSDFLKPDNPYKPADVYPWKFNRSLSYLRRPFLRRECNGEIEVIWGIRHLYSASQYLIYLCLNGRLKAQSSEMKKVTSDLRNKQGEAFNDKVADLLAQDSTLVVHRRVKKIGKTKIQVGDIDVLVADPTNLCIKVIECKNFALARAPHEMKNELDQLFLGRQKRKGREKSAVEHHQERVDWVRDHLHDVVRWLELDSSTDWSVEPLIVTDYELATPHIYSSPIPVVSFVELSKTLSLS